MDENDENWNDDRYYDDIRRTDIAVKIKKYLIKGKTKILL